MKRSTIVWLYGMIWGLIPAAMAQSIQVNPENDPVSDLPIAQLVENVLIDRDAIQLISSSVQLKQNDQTATSAEKSWGYFKYEGTDFPFEEGMILTTGSAKAAEGPKVDDDRSIENSNWLGDDDLTLILNRDNISDFLTFNATSLQFDFIPNGTTLAFNFIFASEEYERDFECISDGSLRDGFAFLIRGPGIADDSGTSFGGTNIAVIPGSTGVPVNTGSIHINTNPDGTLYRCPNPLGGTPPFLEELGVNFFPEFYVSNPLGSETLQYDGYTTVLPAEVTVIPGATYTLKLVIADRGDDEVDSAVFLQGLSTNTNVIIEHTSVPTPVSQNVVLCSNNTPQTLTARFVARPFSGNETYVWRLNDEVIPGADTNTIEITTGGIYAVSVTDGSEKTRDYIEVTVSSGPETLELSVASTNLTQHTITAFATGTGTLTYRLDEGAPQESPIFQGVAPGQHRVTVADLAGCGSITKTIFVTGFPKFFTPNGDGFHDTWNAVGDQALSQITISIFDRHGKFITSFRADRKGWDGTYQGTMMPASEYWFSAKTVDGKENTGHFSLIR